MKLDRNTKNHGKYAIINLRKLEAALKDERFYSGHRDKMGDAVQTLTDAGLLNFGEPNTENEFFVLMLKDRCTPPALGVYAAHAAYIDEEYANDVKELFHRALNSPFRKDPD